MPLLMRRQSIRMLESACDYLAMAVHSLNLPERFERRSEAGRHSAAIGLTGASLDLLIKAMLFQAYGRLGIARSSGELKTVRETLADFRTLLSEPVQALDFLVHGVARPAEHIGQLRQATERFPLVCTARAEALHAGMGASYGVVAVLLGDVSAFLELLSVSERIGPYLRSRPVLPASLVERQVLIEDLARTLASQSSGNLASAIRSLFLVLPAVPPDVPDWLDALERMSVAPRVGDVEYLLGVLETAQPAVLFRQAGSGLGLPVRVDQGNTHALPISPQFLRRTFTQIRDQWAADVANANGRLGRGVPDFPPLDATFDLIALGLEGAGVISTGEHLSGHQVWPTVASSLNVQGTPGPYWFMIEGLNDQETGQVLAYVGTAAGCTGRILRSRLPELESGIRARSQPGNPALRTSSSAELLKSLRGAQTSRARLPELFERSVSTPREPSGPLKEWILRAVEDEIPIGQTLRQIAETEVVEEQVAMRNYWATRLGEASSEPEDIAGLVAILRSPTLPGLSTIVRKAVRRIDFFAYGPGR
jgi:hypothetical protein